MPLAGAFYQSYEQAHAAVTRLVAHGPDGDVAVTRPEVVDLEIERRKAQAFSKAIERDREIVTLREHDSAKEREIAVLRESEGKLKSS